MGIGKSKPDESEPKKINHESTKGRKHEKRSDKFRIFVMKIFFIECEGITSKPLP